MRRTMLGMSQTELGNALGLTFQQVQKYEKGTNRISASKLQKIAQTLQVPVPFFFEELSGGPSNSEPLPDYVSAFLSSREGVALAKAFARIANAHVRRAIVNLVEGVAGEED
jgi:transcriptional regulator with XRE-family HTH domain